MIYSGQNLTVRELDAGFLQLEFQNQKESVNKFDQHTLAELEQAISCLEQQDRAPGLLVSSGHDDFIVGADITEFLDLFSQEEEQIVLMLARANALFSRIEDLPYPTLSAINGVALGGGFEMCLATDYRVMSESAKVGLPEVRLGIFPGFGGSVRLSRLIGVDYAIEWICSGQEKAAAQALKEGAVDAVVESTALHSAALTMLQEASLEKLDFRARRKEKTGPVRLNPLESMMAFETAKAFVAGKAGKHYPAPVAAIKAMQKHAPMQRDQALEVEARGFAKVARSEVAHNLIGLFLNDQSLKKKSKKAAELAAPVARAAVLGAGIMGGGIAFQSALKGTPIIMKDVRQEGLQLGLSEAAKLLQKRLERGRMSATEMAGVLNRIQPTLSFGDFSDVDLVVEAVVEDAQIKSQVLQDLESEVGKHAIITTNTSTISIDRLAEGLSRPDQFCGMHFFNPVHKMPLVEVIRGRQTSEQCIATVVSYARAMGKTPVVVNDCPGFLVNRILFPYFGGFNFMLAEGADPYAIDRVMERFGWPMGPAMLLDVVGLDTAAHAGRVMAAGYPERMAFEGLNPVATLAGQGRLGQKNGRGFYLHAPDRKGRLQRQEDPEVLSLLQAGQGADEPADEGQIIERMMIPLCLEAVRCLEEGIAESAGDVDMSLIYGLGFPPFLGGALRYIDRMGLAEFVTAADRLAQLGPIYQVTEGLRQRARGTQPFYV